MRGAMDGGTLGGACTAVAPGNEAVSAPVRVRITAPVPAAADDPAERERRRPDEG